MLSPVEFVQSLRTAYHNPPTIVFVTGDGVLDLDGFFSSHVNEFRGMRTPLTWRFSRDSNGVIVAHYKDLANESFWVGDGGVLNGSGLPVFKSMPSGQPQPEPQNCAMSADQIAGIRKHAQQLADPSLCEAWGRLCSRGRIKVVVADDATFVSGEVGLPGKIHFGNQSVDLRVADRFPSDLWEWGRQHRPIPPRAVAALIPPSRCYPSVVTSSCRKAEAPSVRNSLPVDVISDFQDLLSKIRDPPKSSDACTAHAHSSTVSSDALTVPAHSSTLSTSSSSLGTFHTTLPPDVQGEFHKLLGKIRTASSSATSVSSACSVTASASSPFEDGHIAQPIVSTVIPSHGKVDVLEQAGSPVLPHVVSQPLHAPRPFDADLTNDHTDGSRVADSLPPQSSQPIRKSTRLRRPRSWED